MALALRPISVVDIDFLRGLYASTRADEMLRVPWTDDEKQAFLDMQFTAQHRHYQQHFAAAAFDLVLWCGEPVGRLYVLRSPKQILLIDIALLPLYRGRGIGSRLLSILLTEAASAQLPVRLHVEHENPARAWYLRLGFEDVDDRGVYMFMEWRPERTS